MIPSLQSSGAGRHEDDTDAGPGPMRRWVDRNLQGDPVIWAVVILLSLTSLLEVYSAVGSLAFRRQGGDTEYYLLRHGMLLFAALVVMLASHRLDYRILPNLTRLALLIAAPLLLIAYKYGAAIDQASRWLTIPVINQSFQPSDLAKLALVTHVAYLLSRSQERIADVKETLFPILLWAGGICGLIALSNFSTAMLLMATCVLLMVIGRVPLRHIGMLCLVGVLFGGVAFAIGQRGATLVSRIEKFSSGQEIPFQAQQAYIALANGGMLGVGPGNSQQKEILPQPYSDFIYAIIVEETGLLGGLFVMGLYLLLLYRGMVTVARSQNAFGALLSAGLSFMLAIQAMLNMAVAVGLVPITGQPLPLLSMGGTSLLFTGLSLGLILSVSRGLPESRPATAPGSVKGNQMRGSKDRPSTSRTSHTPLVHG